MTDAPKLLPCPFCGKEPYTRTRPDEDICTHNIVDWHFVGCSNCDVSFNIPDGYDAGTASEQWNTRADIAAKPFTDAEAAERLLDRFALEFVASYGSGDDEAWRDGVPPKLAERAYDFLKRIAAEDDYPEAEGNA